jgi:hypothetical protein
MIVTIITSGLGYAVIYENEIITQSRDINTLLARIENRTLEVFDNDDYIEVRMDKKLIDLIDQKYKALSK